MTHFSSRRTFLLTALSTPLLCAGGAWAAQEDKAVTPIAALEALERRSGGRLGVFARNTANAGQLFLRPDERFPLCSTGKALVAAAILRQSMQDHELLARRIRYRREELITYSPITAQGIAQGMTVTELCAAALQYSDNTAMNLLLKILGGPKAVTAFARSIGDSASRLDRWETELNTAIPGDERDTTTPAAMAQNLQRLLLGDALDTPQQAQLQEWMLGNTTGDGRIRAGAPGWQVADKTGTGDYGTTNDIGVMWPPGKPPVILTLYFTQNRQDAKMRNDVLASATRIVAAAMG